MRYLLLTLLFICAACATPVRWPAVPPASTLAVAHFIHPQNDWELMAGVLPEDLTPVNPETLAALDADLADILEKRGVHPVMRAAMVRQCEEIVLASKERRRFEAVEYWKAVGQCLQTEFLLVPYVTRWQERQGGEWGVQRPAGLTVDLYLIEVASGQVRRYHFEEEQRGLAENLLLGKRFFKRHGRWVTPREIAADALEEGTRELGL